MSWRLRNISSTLLASILSISHAQAQHSGDLLEFSNATLPPVTTIAGDGYLDRVLDEMFKRAGLDYKLLNLPPARGLAQANAGLLAGDIARTEVPVEFQANLLRLPEPVIEVVFAGLHLSAEISVQAPEDFDGYRVGFVRGWRIAETLFAGKANAIPVVNADMLLKMLQAGRIDIAFLTIAPGRYLARAINLENLHSTEYRINRDLHIYLHVNHAAKIPVLTSALLSMRDDGSYQDILVHYEKENR